MDWNRTICQLHEQVIDQVIVDKYILLFLFHVFVDKLMNLCDCDGATLKIALATLSRTNH